MSRKSAFTLVELLVVVAIIALLVSILLPSLETSREQARTVTCAARLHDMGTAGNVYGNLFKEWLAGSPGTTGMELLHYNADPRETNIPTIPVQNWDWQSPLAYYSLGYSDFETLKDRSQRWQRLRNLEIFTCPSNNYIAPPFYSGGGGGGGQTGPFAAPFYWPIMPMNSYTTIKTFLYFGRPCDISLDMGQCDAIAQLDSISRQVYFPSGAGTPWGIRTPESHTPRLSNIEVGASKVWVADGARFAPTGISPIDFDVNFKAEFGGAFSAEGASSAWSRAYVNPVEFTSMDDARHDRYAYRHPRGAEPGLNLLFFDGHAEGIGKVEAIKGVDLWYPRGSIINAEEIIPNSGSATNKQEAWDVLVKRTPVPGIQGANPFYPVN